jgi:iron(III) transport system ATP-binding protein
VTTPLGTFSAGGLSEGAAATVAVRPQGIRIRRPGQGIPGRLDRRRFLGVVELVEIAVEGLDRPLKGRVRDHLALADKSEIGIEVDPAEVLVFAAPDA